MKDLRAPLHDDARTDDDGRSTSPPPWRRARSKSDEKDNDNDDDDEIPSAATKAARVQPPPIPNDHYSSPRSAASNDAHCYLERIVRHQLCRMHVASRVLELGSESRFTGIVLFHRYVRRFRRHVFSSSSSSSSSSADLRRTVASHLGKVASACILLGCKMEEEPRRIRDVVSLSRLLDFSSSREDDDGGDDDERDRTTSGGDVMGPEGANDDGRRRGCRRRDDGSASSSTGRSTTATIVESRRPPPLDERYWKAKDDLVSTEQHVLRMIRFDATVCHPHRCVLAIMETLGFGTGRDGDGGGDGGGGGEDGRRGRRRDDDRNWLLRPDRSEDVILGAFRILNDAALDGTGAALRHPVVVLSCAAISLAASGGGVGGSLVDGDNDDDCGKADNDNDGNAVAATLPDFWWRALDVSTEDITIARDALRKECTWEGVK